MVVNTIPHVDVPTDQPQPDDSQSATIWVENLQGLNATAAALRADTIHVNSASRAEEALAEQFASE